MLHARVRGVARRFDMRAACRVTMPWAAATTLTTDIELSDPGQSYDPCGASSRFNLPPRSRRLQQKRRRIRLPVSFMAQGRSGSHVRKISSSGMLPSTDVFHQSEMECILCDNLALGSDRSSRAGAWQFVSVGSRRRARSYMSSFTLPSVSYPNFADSSARSRATSLTVRSESPRPTFSVHPWLARAPAQDCARMYMPPADTHSINAVVRPLLRAYYLVHSPDPREHANTDTATPLPRSEAATTAQTGNHER
ncbi:hypothetical protein C8Q80DRAFT_371909 [Daedaleopsis nitida]|nr:hypothetical protein C8Q80DRAFT_371909 [Daedaleopsis nitida]